MALSKFASERQLIEDLIVDHITQNCHLYLPEPVSVDCIRPRVKLPKLNYWDTNRGRMLTNPETQIPTSRAGKLFRLRFRVPWDLFNNFLVPMVEEAAWWPPRSSRRARVPLEIEVLISLRRLGRGLIADDVAELSNTAKSTVETIFHEFVDGMVAHFFGQWVKIHTGERLTKAIRC